MSCAFCANHSVALFVRGIVGLDILPTVKSTLRSRRLHKLEAYRAASRRAIYSNTVDGVSRSYAVDESYVPFTFDSSSESQSRSNDSASENIFAQALHSIVNDSGGRTTHTYKEEASFHAEPSIKIENLSYGAEDSGMPPTTQSKHPSTSERLHSSKYAILQNNSKYKQPKPIKSSSKVKTLPSDNSRLLTIGFKTSSIPKSKRHMKRELKIIPKDIEEGTAAKPVAKSTQEPEKIAQREQWQIQKDALRMKFGDEKWSPRKRLSPDALEGIRALHQKDPYTFKTAVLADRFEVSPEAIRRILKSKWKPSAEEEVDRRARWDKRGEKIWTSLVEKGIHPPKKWREMGIGTGPRRRGSHPRIERRQMDDVGITTPRVPSIAARIM